MTIFDTVAGFFGNREAADEQADALRRALADSRDQLRTTRSDLAPYRDLGANASNVLARLYFGTPADPGTRSGVVPVADFDSLRSALTGLPPVRRGDRKRINNALRRIGGLERALDRDTSGFTYRDQRKFDKEIGRRERRLLANLENLGLDAAEFAFSGGTPASGPSLDPFLASPEFQLFGDQNGRLVQETLAALSNAGLADSGLGRKAVADTLTSGLGNAFANFVNRNLDLAGQGQSAATSGANVSRSVNSAMAQLTRGLGAVEGARQANAFAALGDLGNKVVETIATSLGAPAGAGNPAPSQNIFR